MSLQRLIRTDESLAELSAVDYYFIQEDGNMFKSTKIYEPYFFVLTKVHFQRAVGHGASAFIDSSLERHSIYGRGLPHEDLPWPTLLCRARQEG